MAKSGSIVPSVSNDTTNAVLLGDSTGPSFTLGALVASILAVALTEKIVTINLLTRQVKVYDVSATFSIGAEYTFSPVDPTKKSAVWKLNGELQFTIAQYEGEIQSVFPMGYAIVQPVQPTFTLSTLINRIDDSKDLMDFPTGAKFVVVNQDTGEVGVYAAAVPAVTGVAEATYIQSFDVLSGPARLAFE